MSQVIKFPKTIGIAIHSLIFISSKNKRLNVASISELTKSSRFHSAKILKDLVKYGYLKSVRGPSGGFELNMPANEISLLEIWETVEGKFEIKSCLTDHKACVGSVCIFSETLFNIHEKLYLSLKDQTIQDLIDNLKESTEE